MARTQILVLEWLFSLVLIGGIAMMLYLLFKALYHITQREFENPNDKLVWVIITICIPMIGSWLYFRNGKNRP
ncbi:MAG: PLDc N-terminal domain-containing protein [Bacteroidota bacterium]